MIVVIPSIRKINLEYLKPLLGNGNKIIVVDDTDDERIKVNAPEVIVLHYSDKKRILGKLQLCIPNKNGVCRDLGLLMAYHIGQDNETVVCLDDDCEVFENYQEKAEKSLGLKKLREAKTAQSFYNPLDLCNLDVEIFPRGFPYEERGKPKDYSYRSTTQKNIVLNLGLWKGVFDINAVDKLYLEKFSFDKVSLKYPQVAVCAGPLVSLCSMNIILKKEVIPAIYQLPMNQPSVPNWDIDRYGDIWGGYICKRLIDIKGDALAVGEPLIYHHKGSSLKKNIRQEHYATIVNLRFCDLIDKACEGIRKDSYLSMYDKFVYNLASLKKEYPESLKSYLFPTVEKMKAWVAALKLKDIKL